MVDYLRQQPKVSFIWGNHDAAWLGAALNHEPLLCHVLRISMRYRRISQLDEGYSIPMTPLEYLANTVYRDDPAEHFMPSVDGLRPAVLVARMQKAAAIMQFKLEGQMIARNPEWGMDHRRLLHRIDHATGTIEIDGVRYPLRDRRLPTIDPRNPYELSREERYVPGSHQGIDPRQPKAARAYAVHGEQRFNVSHSRRQPDLSWLRSLR